MKIKDLEKIINERIINEGINNKQYRHRDLVWEIRHIVNELIKGYTRLYATDNAGKIEIRSYDRTSKYSQSIQVKIKSKVVGKDYHYWSGSVNLYQIIKVEISEPYEAETLEEYVNYFINMQKEQLNNEIKACKNFEDKLKEKNIDFKEFYNMMEQYKNLSYSSREDLAKKYAGDKYYSYF